MIPGRSGVPALPAPVSQEPAVETRCFAQIVLSNYRDSPVYPGGNTGSGACTSALPALAKTHSGDQEIKEEAFSAFWLAALETLGIQQQGCA